MCKCLGKKTLMHELHIFCSHTEQNPLSLLSEISDKIQRQSAVKQNCKLNYTACH